MDDVKNASHQPSEETTPLEPHRNHDRQSPSIDDTVDDDNNPAPEKSPSPSPIKQNGTQGQAAQDKGDLSEENAREADALVVKIPAMEPHVRIKTPSNGSLAQTDLDEVETVSEGCSVRKDYTYTSLVAMQEAQQKRMHKGKKMKSSIRSFYEKQDAVIQSFEETIDITEENQSGLDMKMKTHAVWVSRAAKISFLMNVLLLAAKSVAVHLSGSISVISSLVDSTIDLVSGLIIWYSGRAMRKSNIYKYPVGKQRIEPLAILVLSSIMAVCAVQIIIESINRIVEKSAVNMDIASIVVMCGTIVIKFLLYLFCKRIKSPSTAVLALDHRNDVMSNTVALVCGAIATYYWLYADPIGAIVISMYIFYNWYQTGAVQIKKLAGKTAPPEFLQQITWICLHHDERITEIDTVRAFHIGYNYIVEVDIVLAEDMTLKEAHNVGEPLQIKLEKLPHVERAFVHLDYEYEHNPDIEHKRL